VRGILKKRLILVKKWIGIVVSEIKLYEILKLKLGDKEVEALVEFVESKLRENNEKNLQILATKDDIRRLDIKIAETRADLIKWMFIFWMGQVAVMAGLLAYFFHLNK
jgi:hypothetical protein